MHTIATHQALAILQVIYEEPLLARRYGEIDQDIIIRAIPSSIAIVPYLRQILAIHLAILFLGIDVILIQWFRISLIYWRDERNASHQQ